MNPAQQLSIDFQPKRAARAKDPCTSHIAAAYAERFAASHAGQIYRALLEHAAKSGGDGLTSSELESHVPLTHAQIWRRMADLQHVGRIKDSGKTRPTASGKPSIVWVV